MKKEQGFAHIGLWLIGLTVLGGVVFTGISVTRSNNSAPNSSARTNQAETATQPLTDTSALPPNPLDELSKPAVTTISFNKGGSSVSGLTLYVSATTANKQTGTCTYVFTLGNSKVTKSNSITNSPTCAISIPLSAFPKNGYWDMRLSFVSNDGLVVGGGAEDDILVQPETRTINFTKGGGGQEGSSVHVSADLSEVQTGTCTYVFSLNGTERVRDTSSISNSKRCEKYIPLSSFPKSGNYSFALSFSSSDGLVSATQSPYNIAVN